jgi:hypothetical protein
MALADISKVWKGGRMRRIVSPLVLLPLAALLLCSTPAPAEKARAERPTYTLGEKWIRSDGVYELIRIEDGLYVFAAEGQREIHVTKDLAIVRILREGGVEWEVEPPPAIRWPLEVGKWGQGRLARPQALGGASGDVYARGGVPNLVWSIEAYEEVSTPAGSFKAFRIRHSFVVQGGRSASQEFGSLVFWYAPEVRQLVRGAGKIETPHGFTMFPSFSIVAVEQSRPAVFQIALEGLADLSRVATERVALVGKVQASRGVTQISVSLNGKEISKQEDRHATKQELGLNVPVQLAEGRNVLLVTATDGGGQIRQDARTVFYERMVAVKPAPVPAPNVTPSPSVTIAPPSPPVPVLPAPPPLAVALSSPADKAHVNQETIGLAASASGGKGVRRILVSLNGTEVSRQDEHVPRSSVTLNAPIKLRDGQNIIVVTALDAEGTSQQAVSTVYYEKPVPLTVAIQYPGDGLQVSQENSVVAGLITSSNGVAKVTVSVNGTEIHQQAERAPAKSVALSVPLTLREGANAIVVSAREPDGTVRQEIRTVIYQRPQVAAAPPPALPPPPRPTPNRWAVVIGVGGYESSDIPKLRYAVPDAESIYQVLTGAAGFKKEHVLLLTDKTERRPTLRNIRWALGTFLARSARKDDMVVIFFAGHGAPEADLRGLERDGLAKYLIPSDADSEDLYSSALPMDELQTIFGRIEAERVVAFLDTCYSGAAGGRTFLAKRTRSSQVDDLFLERLTRSKGRAIITASRPGEVSMELPELGHGVFTYYLLQGLNGAADLNHDGIVTVQELYDYVEQQVTQKSRAVGGNQHPVMKGELEGVLPLVKVRGK